MIVNSPDSVHSLGHAATAANLFSQLAPSASQAKDGSKASCGDTNREDDLETLHVSVNDGILLALREGVTNFSRTSEDERGLVDVGGC